MDDKKSVLTTLPPLLVAVGTLITAVIGLGNFMSSPAPSITEFDVSPSIIDTGGNATIKWAVSGDVSSISIEPEIGAVALSGSRQISPVNTTNYTLTAENKGQVKKASACLIVRATAKVFQGAIEENNNGSIQIPAALSIPLSARNVGDEPVQTEVPIVKDAAKDVSDINGINNVKNANTANNASNANNANAANNANNANSATNANTINTTNSTEKAANDKSAKSSELTLSGPSSKYVGDEFVQKIDLESTSKSKDTIRPINASTNNSAAGDEPIQMTGTKSASNASKILNAASQKAPAMTVAATKAASTGAASNVGDIA